MQSITAYLCALLMFGQVNAATDRWIGTWKLNGAKSHYESGVLPKSRTLTFTAVPGGVKAMSDLLDDVGIVHIEFDAKFDGKDVPMRGGPPGPTIAVMRTDASTFDTLQKANGKVTYATHFVVSRDGKTLTATATGADPEGKKFTNVSVYDKQM